MLPLSPICALNLLFRSATLLVLDLAIAISIANSASFDCNNKTTAIEMMVCNNLELSKLDEKMADSYRASVKKASNMDKENLGRYRAAIELGEKPVTYENHVKNRQRRWLKELIYCETVNCLKEVYRQRIKALLNEVGGAGYTSERIYRYKLEMSQDDQVCLHMQNVYNKYFREPWNFQTFPNIRHEDYFQRLPGIDYNEKMTMEMSYSRFPSSIEFDRIKWREGRYYYNDNKCDTCQYPFLVSELDIDNNGSKEIVFKLNFMWGFTTRDGGNENDKGSDSLRILPKDDFVINGIIDLRKSDYGLSNSSSVSFLEGRQLRPFILDGVTYLSKYESIWPSDEVEGLPTGEYPLPTQEYLHIHKYRGGGQFVRPGKYTETNLQPICRLRMLPKP